MNEVCIDIVNNDGLAWQANKPLFDRSSFDVKDSLGVRDQILSNNVFRVVENGTLSGFLKTYVEVPHHDKLDAVSLFTLAIFVNMPVSSNNGLVSPLVCKTGANGYFLYQKDGDIYFEISESMSGVEKISTVTSGVNFCDGNSHLIFVVRDTRYSQAVLSLEVYGEYEIEKNIVAHNASNTSALFLGAANPNGLSDPSLFAATNIALYGFIFLRGKALDKREKYLYYKRGQAWANDMIQLQLDEVTGEICYDSAGLGNHGVIRNYIAASRFELDDAFSWSNQYGYNTGAYVISQGFVSLTIGGEVFNVDSNSIIPFQTGHETKDVFNLDLQENGRGRKNVKITKILCYKGNGSTYATLPSPAQLIVNPITGSLGFCCGFINTLTSVGTIFSSAYDNSSPALRVSVAGTFLTVTVGNLILSPVVAVGEHILVVNITAGFVTMYVDGVLVASGTASTFISTGTPVVRLFSDGTTVLNNTSIAFVGFSTIVFGSIIRGEINEGDLKSTHNYSYLAVPMEKANVLTDCSGYARSVIFTGYLANVWTGRQSLCLHFMKGFSKVFQSATQLNIWAFIPYSVQGSKVPVSVYGTAQLELECVPTEGLPKHDFFVNFNPDTKALGFYSRFWNKDSVEIWTGLSSLYDSGNIYEFHIDELSKSYLNTALDPEWYNYAFLTEIVGISDICKEITDILLINLGSDFQPKSFS